MAPQRRPSQHAGWPAMMKTWIGPSLTGSDAFATLAQVSTSSAIVLLPWTILETLGSLLRLLLRLLLIFAQGGRAPWLQESAQGD